VSGNSPSGSGGPFSITYEPRAAAASTRQLGRELAISRIPVLVAYEQLLAEGYLETFKGAGTCVARSIPQQTSKTETLRPDRVLRVRQAVTVRRLSRRAAAMAPRGSVVLNNLGAFRVGCAGLGHFPPASGQTVNRHARKP